MLAFRSNCLEEVLNDLRQFSLFACTFLKASSEILSVDASFVIFTGSSPSKQIIRNAKEKFFFRLQERNATEKWYSNQSSKVAKLQSSQ